MKGSISVFRKIFMMCALMLGMTSVASAVTVTFSAAGSQLCVGAAGCGVASQTLGNIRLAFVARPAQTITFTGSTFTSFGQLVVSCVGGGTSCADQDLSASAAYLYINIAQTSPSAGNSSFLGGQFVGVISGTASNANIQWASTPQARIGVIQYRSTSNPVGLNSPSFNGGSIDVNALIDDLTGVSVTPTLFYSPAPNEIVIAQSVSRGNAYAAARWNISSSGAANDGSTTVSNCAVTNPLWIGAGMNTPSDGVFNASVTNGILNAVCERGWQPTTAKLTCTETASPGTATQRSWPLVCPSFITDGADIDGNGSVNALTDGLLITRYLLGLRGNALVQGAIGPGGTRNTAALIQQYLQLLTGQ